jgi:hypothetical protein
MISASPEAGKAEAGTTASPSLRRLLLRARPHGDIQDVVEHPDGGLDDIAEAFEVEYSLTVEGSLYEPHEVDRAETSAAAIRRQPLFTTIVNVEAIRVE